MDSDALERRASFDAVFSTREQFLESCKAQEFSLPKPIMKYIWENPSSPEVYEKLIKSCKLFFLKNPILVLKNLEYYSGSGWKCCNSNECNVGYTNFQHRCKTIKMNNFEGKIWLTKKFKAYSGQTPNIASYIISKLYQNDIKILTLGYQVLSYDDLKLLAAGVEECALSHNTVTYENGVQVPMDEVIKLFSGAKIVTLYYASDSFISSENTRYAEFFNACCSVEKIYFYGIPSYFNIHKFYQQMKRYKNRASINIYSRRDGEYFNAITDEILNAESFEFVPPVILYFGQSQDNFEKMKEIQEREIEKYR